MPAPPPAVAQPPVREAPLVPLIRPFRAGDDYEYVIATWMNSYWKSAELAYIPYHVYIRYQRKIIELILQVQSVRIACDPTADDVIWGWACGDPEDRLVHYVYVKGPKRDPVTRRPVPGDHGFRRGGIARRLIEEFAPRFGWPNARPADAAIEGPKGPIPIAVADDLPYGVDAIMVPPQEPMTITHLPPHTDHGQGQTWLLKRVQREIDEKKIFYNPYRAFMRVEP